MYHIDDVFKTVQDVAALIPRPGIRNNVRLHPSDVQHMYLRVDFREHVDEIES